MSDLISESDFRERWGDDQNAVFSVAIIHSISKCHLLVSKSSRDVTLIEGGLTSMAARRINVFFYGLFMDAGLLRAKDANPLNIRLACVPGYALRIGQRATLIESHGDRAYGMLMELTHDEIEQLYFEASVREYRPEAVLAELSDRSRIPALCFNLAVPPVPADANSEYAGKLRTLAGQLGLPTDYVESIR